MEDVAPQLLDEIGRRFSTALTKSVKIRNIAARIEAGTASLGDVQVYSRLLGEQLGRVLQTVLTPENLPDGKLYWNIAERTILPLLQDNHELVAAAAVDAQRVIDAAAGIGLNPIKPAFQRERAKGLLDLITQDGIDNAQLLGRLGAPVQNFVESTFDQFIEDNAAFRAENGMDTVITRRLAGAEHHCKWCRSLAGVYDYDKRPADVYRRHVDCHCLITYQCEKGKRVVQNYRPRKGDDKLKTLNLELERR